SSGSTTTTTAPCIWRSPSTTSPARTSCATSAATCTSRRARSRLPEFEKQILVAGVGNAWMLDDGFGSVVAQRLETRDMPSGVKVMDAGSGGLDLAYEIMRGYHALVLVDVSRQDGEAINPHGMDPATVLRFVRAVGGWSGKVVIVACEPGEVEDLGLGLSPAL